MNILLAIMVTMSLGNGPRTEVALATGWRSVCTAESGAVMTRENLEIPHNWAVYFSNRWYGHGDLHGTAVYERTFECRPEPNRRAYLHFGGAGSYLSVNVNGKEICKHRPVGKVTATLDVTDALDASGHQQLKVTCEHPSQIMDMPWVCGGCSAAYCEGPEPLGLFRMVKLIVTDEVRIAPFGVFVWGKAPFNTIHIESEITNAGKTAAERELVVKCAALGIDRMEKIELAPGETKIFKAEIPVKNVHRWSAEDPFLYNFDVTLLADGKVKDADRVTTGFREVSWPFLRETKSRRLYVNGKPVFIHGVCETDHLLGASLAFGPEEIDARAKLIKSTLNFNAVRDGHEPHDLRWGQNWDRLGIYWWPQFGTHNYYDSAAFRENYETLLKQWMKERRNSPSVLIWGIQNESVLPADYARKITKMIHEYDPSSSTLDRLTTTCNYGEGADWMTIQNWSGTYGGDIDQYGKELASDQQLLNGEYGAWRHYGYHGELPAKFDKDGAWTEEHAAYILYYKAIQAWQNRENLCGHFQWLLFTHENPGRMGVDDGYRMLDKIGPVNNKGVMTLWGAPTAQYYMYRAYGDALRRGTMEELAKQPLTEAIRRGKQLDAPRSDLSEITLAALPGKTYLYRLNCGGDEATDNAGNKWLADSTFFSESWAGTKELADKHLDPLVASQGELAEGVANVTGADSAILSTYRWGRDRLKFFFTVAPKAKYTVEAYFTEPGGYGHVFDVAVNGRVIERAFDLTATAGTRGAVKRSWEVESDANGRLELSFPKVEVCQAVIAAIAISTDAATAAKCAARIEAGYPATAGKSWKALAAEVVPKVPNDKLPFFDRRCRIPVQPITEISTWRYSTFILNLSNQYSIRFKLRYSARPRQDIWWTLVTVAGKRLMDEGPIEVPKSDKEIVYEVPVKPFINAGSYTVSVYCPDGTLVEAAEMFETPGKGQ